jgi:hypothetical protein
VRLVLPSVAVKQPRRRVCVSCRFITSRARLPRTTQGQRSRQHTIRSRCCKRVVLHVHASLGGAASQRVGVLLVPLAGAAARRQVRVERAKNKGLVLHREYDVVEEVFLCCCGFAVAARFPIDASQVGVCLLPSEQVVTFISQLLMV